MKEIYRGRSGELENTVFCLLAPDGKTQLSEAGRGPQFAFRSPESMAKQMLRLALQYEPTDKEGTPFLPQMKNFRLGLNVAECDRRPLVVCVAPDDESMKALHAKLSPAAFQEDLAGRFGYASIRETAEMESISGEKTENGFLIVAPGEFGTDGHAQQVIAADVSAEELSSQLIAYANQYQRRQKDHRGHVRNGQENGVDWQSEIPVTDPMSNAAKQRRSGDKRGKRRDR